MRGLTDEERAALLNGDGHVIPPSLAHRLIRRGLLGIREITHGKCCGQTTPQGLLALRLDAAARALTGVMS